MNGIARLVIGLAAVAFVFALGSISQLRADAYSDQVAAIVEQGWLPQGGVEAALRRHAAAVQLNTADSRADYALALVQMRHGDWEAATESLATAARKDPADLYAWRAHVWLLVYQRQFDAVMKEITALADSFAATPPADVSAQARRRAAAKIMGRVAGYLAGPRQGDVDETALKQWQAALIAKLGKENSTAFADGRQEIATEHKRLLDAIDAEKADTLAANQAEKEDDQEFVATETARIETERRQLEQLAADAKQVLDEQTSQLDSELSPIQLSYADVEARARPFQLRIVELQSRLNTALAEANIRDGERATEDERRRNRERREGAQRLADRLRFELRREDEFLRPFVAEAQRLQAAAAVIERRRQAAVATYQATYAGLDAQARTLQRTGKLLKAKERELGRTVSGTSGKVFAMRAQLNQWPTYETFPLEAERQRLLGAK